MRRFFEIGRWLITLSTTRKRNAFCRTKTEIGWRFYWRHLSLEIEDWSAEVHPLCAPCGSVEVGEVSSGDESWTVCGSCRSVEQGYRYVNLKEFENA